jgi:hypothetical protein
MTTALLILMLVNATDAQVLIVDRELCLKTAESVRMGQRTTLEDEAGVLWEIEMARCLTEPESLRVPLS